MSLKRYYTILLCLLLIIVSCLLASFAISRKVGDLDGDGDSTGASLASKLAYMSGVVEEQETRNIDLIDLVESGKTFAFTKYRIQVRVPKSTPNYDQHPSFLMENNNDISTAAASTTTTSKSLAVSSQSNLPAEEDKFYLTSLKEQQEQHLANNAAEENPLLAIKATNGDKDNPQLVTKAISGKPEDGLLNLEIKPIAQSKKNDAITPGIEDIAALLAMTTTGEKRSEGLGSVAAGSESLLSNRIPTAPINLEQMDPVEQAASELHFNLNSTNKTLVDCFLVDTEKRYDQKVNMEDLYRQVAVTRRISSKQMMNIIVDCRKLTWASLPDTIRIKSIPGERPLVTAASQAMPTTTTQSIQLDTGAIVPTSSAAPKPSHDIIGTLLGSWLGHSRADSAAADLISSKSNPSSLLEPKVIGSGLAEEESRERQLSLLQAQQPIDLQQQQRQASLINMGISMVNGIIPNTLWCGLGDRAANYSELGAEYKVDACCRAHDHCPVRLKPFTTDYGLVNWSMSTKSHCNCDLDFNDCLLAINSTLSNVIKTLYFRFVGLQCIDVESRQASTSSP